MRWFKAELVKAFAVTATLNTSDFHPPEGGAAVGAAVVATTGRPPAQLLQSVQSVPALQYRGSSHSPSLAYRQVSEFVPGKIGAGEVRRMVVGAAVVVDVVVGASVCIGGLLQVRQSVQSVPAAHVLGRSQ